MPRENRKRGKKQKKTQQVAPQAEHEPEYHEPEAGPSWIVSGPDNDRPSDEAPFGYVDSEVKAYFRTVDVQLREWQEEGYATAPADEDTDPNEGMIHSAPSTTGLETSCRPQIVFCGRTV